MKVQRHSQPRERGSILIVSLLISAIIGITLASYLIMTQAQNTTVARSQTWNSSIPLTEAGVEDALALLNKYSGDYDQITNWSMTAAADNWEKSGNTYHVKRYLGSSYYDVYITNINNAPVITSIGTVPWTFAYDHTPQPLLAAVGVNQSYTPKLITRTVEVRTKFDSLFSVAMAAIQTIDFNGNGVTTDSFDSANPLYSINGQYPVGQISMIRSNGDICSDATIINSIGVGNANVKGAARTGPKGTVQVGSQGYVTGGIYDDFNVVFPNVVLPTTMWLPPTYYAEGACVIDGLPYNYKLTTSGDYVVNGDFSNGIYVGTNARVRVRITSSVSFMNLEKDNIRIAPGGSLTIYMEGTQFKIAGKGVINDGGNAAAFNLYGLPSCTDLQFNGNGSYTGTIYCPQATFSLGGGGNDIFDFIGASVTKTVKMNGHFNFHYDENLRLVGPGRGYIATNWKEK